MSLEREIQEVISAKLQDGTIRNLIEKKFEESVNSALDSLFRTYGDATKVIEGKIKEVMIPHLEKYDYSEYIVKLDEVLKQILKNTTLDNKKMLENFKSLMSDVDVPKKIKASELFEKYTKYVSENVSTSGLEVNTDDEPTYESVEVTFEFEEAEGRSWSTRKIGTLVFECEHDEEMNFEVPVYKWDSDKHDEWRIETNIKDDISSLRHLDDFSIYIIKLVQNGTKLEIDTTSEEEDVTPEAEPEASFS